MFRDDQTDRPSVHDSLFDYWGDDAPRFIDVKKQQMKLKSDMLKILYYARRLLVDPNQKYKSILSRMKWRYGMSYVLAKIRELCMSIK